MMRRLPAILCLLAACSQPPGDRDVVVNNGPEGIWQQTGESTVSFRLEQTYGREDGAEEEMLEGPRRGTVDTAGNLYLHDGERIVAFGPTGSVLWEIDATGEGPGELNRVRALFLGRDDLLWVTNQSSTRIDRFDLSGNFVDTRSVEPLPVSRATAIGSFEDGSVLLASGVSGRFGNRLFRVESGPGMTIVDSMTVDQTGDLPSHGAISVGATVGLVHDRIAVSLIDGYGYLLLSPTLDTLLVTTRPDIPKRAPYGFLRNGNPAVIMLGSAFAPVLLRDGRWLGGASWAVDVDDIDSFAEQLFGPDAPTIEYQRSLDLYDESGALLYDWDEAELAAVGIREVLASDGIDSIYARTTDDIPTVGRYRLVIE